MQQQFVCTGQPESATAKYTRWEERNQSKRAMAVVIGSQYEITNSFPSDEEKIPSVKGN